MLTRLALLVAALLTDLWMVEMIAGTWGIE